ncbi:MAG: hypothetical protein DRN15_02870 [Thermoprotei archaeon]|nr:MAG: hypothetical protein DRN15_02870 [Thermoprotei archaeon]
MDQKAWSQRRRLHVDDAYLQSGFYTSSANSTIMTLLLLTACFVMSLIGTSLGPVMVIRALKMKATQVEIGLIGGMSSFTYAVMTLSAFYVSKMIGRKKALMYALASYTIALLTYLVATNPYQLMIGRAIEGMAWGLFWPFVETVLAELLGVESMVPKFSTAWSSGAIVGSMLIAVLLKIEPPIYLLIYMTVVMAYLLPLTKLKISSDRTREMEKLGLKGLAMGLRSLWHGWTLLVVSYVCMGLWLALTPAHMKTWGYEDFIIGLCLFTLMSMRTLTFILLERMSKALNEKQLENIFLVLPVAVIVPVLTRKPIHVIIASAALGVGLGLVYATVLRQVLSEGRMAREVMTGLFEFFIGIGFFIGPTIGGLLASIEEELAYIGCALITALAVMMYRLHKM